MKRILIGVATLLPLAAAVVPAEQREQIYSRPAPPAREVLDRLNLVMAWHTYVPTDGRRDALASVEVLGRQVLVQTKSGLVVLLDADTGQTVWRARVGRPYEISQPPGSSKDTLFVTRGTTLSFMDRGTGQVRGKLDLPAAASAPATADRELLYVCLDNDKLLAYDIRPLPGEALPASAPPAGSRLPPEGEPAAQPQPAAAYAGMSSPGTAAAPLPIRAGQAEQLSDSLASELRWEHRSSVRLEYAPLVTPYYVLVTDSNRSISFLSRMTAAEVLHLPTDGPATAPPGRYGDVAYVACADGNVYAIDMDQPQELWHFPRGTPIRSRPQATEHDVYVASEDEGLYRLNRLTGDPAWGNKRAARFLAANPKFVYAADRSGRLLILDRARGTELSGYDTHDFVVPVSNNLTDRLFLAANDGLLICLHDRQYVRPIQHRKEPERKLPPKPPEKPPEKAPEEKAVGELEQRVDARS